MTRRASAAPPALGPPPAHYPSCLHELPKEKQLYRRLQKIYNQYSDTWDDESRSAWFSLIEKATLARTTTTKVSSHGIAKQVGARPESVTWAHFVILKAIFKQRLFKSKKTLKIIQAKYPSANYSSNAFSESFRQPLPGSELKRKTKPSPAPASMGRSPSKEPAVEATKAIEENMKAVEPPQPSASIVPAASAPRRPLPVSRPRIKTEPSDKAPKPAAAPARKRKRAPKPDGATVLKAPKLEPADSQRAPEQAPPAVAQDSRESPAVPAVADDCPADSKPALVKAEEPAGTVGQQPPARGQKGTTRGRQPGPAAKTQVEDLLQAVADKFEAMEGNMRRQEQKLAAQADQVRKLGRETRRMNAALLRLRRWVTVAQSQGVPVPPRVWDGLRRSYEAHRAGEPDGGAKQGGAAPVGGQEALDGASCAGNSSGK